MIFANLSATSNYFLLNYLTNLFQQVYTTAIFAACSEVVGYAFSGWLLVRLGVRKSFLISAAIGACGGLSIIFYGLEHQDSITFPILFLVCKMGSSCCFNLSYAACPRIFEVKRATRVLGVANFFARAFSALAPILSTVEQPVPMLIFVTSISVSGILAIFVIEP